jgi:hypothetical protein
MCNPSSDPRTPSLVRSQREGLKSCSIRPVTPRLHGEPTMQSQMQPLSAPKLGDVYAEALPNSRQLFARAQQIFPDGVTHDNRRMQPFPIYGERAEGAYK